MKLARDHLTILLNALHDAGERRVDVAHPSPEVGTLLELRLESPGESRVRVRTDRRSYGEARGAVELNHGGRVADDLPAPGSYVKAFVAGGLLDLENQDAVERFLRSNGGRDLTAGHHPLFAGFDTNLLPWRMTEVLGIDPESRDPTVNGFTLATGVRDELDWTHKHGNTAPLVEAFGPEFEELWNQPAGANREGRLGSVHYRRLRDHRYGDEVESDTGDEAIVAAYDEYQRNSRKDVVLFSGDRDFVELARSHSVLAHYAEFPTELPRTVKSTWEQMGDTLYVLAVLFGALKLPKVTVYGAWRGKTGNDWTRENLKVASRSPTVESRLKRDTEILDAFTHSR